MQEMNSQNYDSFQIGKKSYVKETALGPKAWGAIQSISPGKFIDIMESKFSEKNFIAKVDTTK